MMQYTHRQRGSEAAVPILVSGMKAIGCDEQPLPRIVFWQDRRVEELAQAKTDDFPFLLLTGTIDLFR